jgi:hypothetical protein
MVPHQFPHQPTLKHLLNSEAMADAQVLFGQDLLDRPVVQVVTGLTPPPKAGSLLIARPGMVGAQDAEAVSELAGLIVIRPYVVPADAASVASGQGQAGSLAVGVEVDTQRLVQICADAEVPLILVPGFGELAQIAEDIRLAFLAELKRASARMHAVLLSMVIEDGLGGVVEELSSWISRPVACETADFKILAAKNMGPTPPSQQRTLTEEVAETINRQMRAQDTRILTDLCQKPFRIGRRLVMPILLDGVVVAYLSAMVKPTDDIDAMAEYLYPAALAAMIDLSQRRKEVSAFTVNQKSLLKDLLSGRTLSSADQERFDQTFGFDLCDGLLVFAAQAVTANPEGNPPWPEEPYPSTEVEGTRVFVIPYHKKSERTWQQEAELLVELIKKTSPGVKVQLGAGRITESTLDLADGYREARQALIVGSMIHSDEEFVLGYGELGVKRLLYLMIDHPEFDRFYEENLSPLEAYDAEWETELVPTLQVYLQQGANLNSAARALFIHRHTLRYRLEQIAELLNVDIDSQEVLLNLQIAYLIKDMKGTPQV